MRIAPSTGFSDNCHARVPSGRNQVGKLLFSLFSRKGEFIFDLYEVKSRRVSNCGIFANSAWLFPPQFKKDKGRDAQMTTVRRRLQ